MSASGDMRPAYAGYDLADRLLPDSKLSRDSALRYPGLREGANLGDVGAVELRSGTVVLRARLSRALGGLVGLVFTGRAPGEVVESAVRLVAAREVPTVHAGWARTNESLENEPVHGTVAAPSSNEEGQHKVSVSVHLGLEWSRLRRRAAVAVYPVPTANATKRAGFVSIRPWNRLPNFVIHRDDSTRLQTEAVVGRRTVSRGVASPAKLPPLRKP